MSPSPAKDPPNDIGTVNQAVIDALLCRRWAELERLVPRAKLVDPCPDLETPG